MPDGKNDENSVNAVRSPFSDADGFVSRRTKGPSIVVWGGFGAAVVVLLLVAGIFVVRHLNDPLRTLEHFPVAKYLDDYRALAGSRFQGSLRVENDLGWKEGIGRIMVFTMENEPRPIAVMIPPSLASIYFVKGQKYQAELEVKEGGLIYANSCRKN